MIDQIIINQKRLCALTPKITLFEAAILSYFFQICRSEDLKMLRDKGENSSFTLVNLSQIQQDLPILHFKSLSSISERIQKLEKLGYIKGLTIPDSQGKKLYIQLTKKTKDVFDNTQPIIEIQPVKNEQPKDFKDLVKFFVEQCQTLRGYKPELPSWPVIGKMIKNCRRSLTDEEIKEVMLYYLRSEKCRRLGASIIAALSISSINYWKEHSTKKEIYS